LFTPCVRSFVHAAATSAHTVFLAYNRDAWSVCSGKKMEEHHVIDAKTELMATKMAEMICESIPGCLLQIYVILKVGDTSGRAVTSVVVSALTAGYSSGTLR